MKTIVIVMMVSTGILFHAPAHAQIPILDIIKAGIKKVIRAVDLQVQRLQNETIWLQNAQKTLENEMSKLQLGAIKDWVEKQRKQYADYFDELWRIKAAIAYYHKVKGIIERQAQIVKEYKAAWSLFRQDKNFTAKELDYIFSVYSGIFDNSIKNIDQLNLVINAFATQMSDAKRMEIINEVSDDVEENYAALRSFNEQNKMLSLRRASEQGEIDLVKRLYGIQ